MSVVQRCVCACRQRTGYLAGGDYYNYNRGAPEDIAAKRERYRALVQEHGVDLRTVALKLCNAPDVVAAVIPGASSPEQVRENVASNVDAQVPDAFWQAAKSRADARRSAHTWVSGGCAWSALCVA